MTDVTFLLQEMANRADEQQMPDPQTLREDLAPASRRRRLVRTGALAAAAASAVLVIGTGVPALRGDQSAPSPADEPRLGERTPAPIPTTDFETEPYGEEDGWQEITFGPGVSWSSVAYRNGTYVAVADTSRAEIMGDEATAAGSVPMWWSADGRAWTRVEDGTGPPTVNVWSVVAADTGFVALAAAPGGTVPWLSQDGRSWRASDSLPDGFRPYGLVETDLGLVAWGRGRVWLSADGGLSWDATSDEPIWPRVQHSFNPCWIGQSGNGLQALVLREGGGPDGTVVRWASDDGRTWRQVGDVDTPNPLTLCTKYYEQSFRTDGAPGTVAIGPYHPNYAGSLFFRAADWDQR